MHSITIEPVSKANAAELLAFETQNKAYFEALVGPRAPGYFEPEQFYQQIDEIALEFQQGLRFMYVIRNEIQELVGRVNLFSVVWGPFQKAEIGYRVGCEHQGKGYATGAVALALKEAFEVRGLHRIEAGTAPNNIGSQIVLIKNGFQYVGKSREVIQINGKWEDSLLFERLTEK